MDVNEPIELGKPIIGKQELEAIEKVFDTGWVINGPTTREFEDKFREYVVAKHAVSVVNCTAGMELALKALDLPEGSKVVIPGQSFIANGIAVMQNGYSPLFCDVDPRTYNLNPESLEERAESADAVLLVHYAGYPCDLDPILEIADEYDLAVVEDAAHALGSQYKGDEIGVHGDATVFSFGPLKMITTGMGGMVTTPRSEIAEKLRILRSYGMNVDAWDRDEDPRSWQYSIPELGHNYRLNDVAAGMGLSQLDKIGDFIGHRRTRAEEYNRLLKGIQGIQTPPTSSDRFHTYLYYVIRVTDQYTMSRDKLAEIMMESDVGMSVHWDPPLHQHSLIRKSFNPGQLPVSEQLADELMTLPMHPDLTKDEVEYICNLIDTSSG